MMKGFEWLLLVACILPTKGCDPAAKLLSDIERRSTSTKLGLTDPLLQDNRLSLGWYNGGDGDTTYVMADNSTIPNVLYCSTFYPMYLKESHPHLDPGNQTTAVVCLVDTVDSCNEEKKPISIRNCDGVYEYKIGKTDSLSAYCFEPKQKSNTAPSDSVLRNAAVEVGLTYTGNIHTKTPSSVFLCSFDVENFFYHVYWYINNDLVKECNATTGSNVTQSTVLADTDMKNFSYGITIHCGVAASFNQNGPKTNMTFSKGYFAGVKVVSPSSLSIVMKKGETKEVVFQNTVPVGCEDPAYRMRPVQPINCNLEVRMFDPRDNYNCTTTSLATLSTDSKLCGVKIPGITFNMWHNLNSASPCTSDECRTLAFSNTTMHIKTKNDAQYEKGLQFTLRLETFQKNSLWNGYHVTDISVTVLNDNTWERKVCSSHIDPHVTTGDRMKYEHQDEGQFLLYENTKYDIVVQERTAPCYGGSAFCACSITVRAGGDIFMFSVCGNNKYINFLRCSDDILQVRRINDNNYQIHTPIGTSIEIRRHGSFLNVDITMSPKDLNNVEGLCGKFDGNITNDLYQKDGQTFPASPCGNRFCWYDARQFANTWRVADSEVLSDPDNFGKFTSWVRNYTLCVCPFVKRNTGQPINDSAKHDDALCSPADYVTCTNPKPRRGERISCTISRRRRSLHAHFQDLKHRFEREKVETIRLQKRSTAENNITVLEEGIKECRDYLEDQEGYQQFAGDLPESDATDTMIGNCGSDYAYMTPTDDIKMSHLEGWKSKNLNEIEKNITYQTEHNNTVKGFEESNCLNNCTSNGVCVKGVCNCSSGFVGDDCSINLSDPIDVEYIEGGGLCNRQHDACDLIAVQAENMIKSVVCKIERIKRFNDGTAELQTNHTFPGERVNIFLTHCVLPFPDNEPSSEPPPFVIKHNVYVSNDGTTFGGSEVVYVYDSLCQNYTTEQNDEKGFYLMTDTCFIDGICRLANETSSADPCSICNPSKNTSTWTTISSNACVIDGVCVDEGRENTMVDCLHCDVGKSNVSWTIKPNGACVINGVCIPNGQNNDSHACLECIFDNDLNSWTISDGNCFINNQCIDDQDKKPDDPCSYCSPVDSSTEWTRKYITACIIDGVCVADGHTNTSLDCLKCSVGKDVTRWTVIEGKCFINDECKNDQERSPEEPCSFCSPADKTEDWTIEHTAACVIAGMCIPDGQKNTTFDCLECSSARDEQAWSVTDGNCFINNQCIDDQDKKADDPCSYCSPVDSSTEWTRKYTTACIIDDICVADGHTNATLDCLQCSVGKETTGWTVIDGNCFISNQCIDDQDKKPDDPCSYCSPVDSSTEWTRKFTTACIIDGVCVADGQTNTSLDCLHCSVGRDTTGWTLILEKCFINDECKNDQERSNEEPCSFCSPANKTDDWTIEHTAACVIDGTCIPDGQKNTTFDCLECSSARDGQAWSVTVGKCFINDECKNDQERSPEEPCSFCTPASKTDEWTVEHTAACVIDGTCIPDGQKNTTFDCLECSSARDEQAWSVTVGKCFINDECKNHQERSPEEPCSFCSPANKTDDWTIEHTAACVIDGTCIPDGQKNTTFDCLECSSARDEQAWSVTVGKCFINNECKNDQEMSPEELCSFCSPANKTDDWTIEHTAACVIDGTCIPDGQKNTTFDCLECSSARDEHEWSVTPLFCYIDEQCVSNGTVSSDDPCNVCNTGESNVAWTYECTTSTVTPPVYPSLGQVYVTSALEYDTTEGQKPYLTFVCNFEAAVSHLYQVAWFVNDITILIKNAVQAGRLTESKLLENDLARRGFSLQINIRCSVTVMVDSKDKQTKTVTSAPFFAGLKVLTTSADFSTSSKVTVTLQQTVPLGCSDADAETGSCQIRILVVDPTYDGKCTQPTVAVQGSTTCGTIVNGIAYSDRDSCTDCWKRNITFELTTLNQHHYNGRTGVAVNLITERNVPHAIWASTYIWNMTVNLKDETIWHRKQCSIVVDPHVTTVDEVPYEHHKVGEFILYRHDQYPLEIQEKTIRCVSNVDAYCTCAVSVRAGGDIFAFNFCDRQTFLGFYSCKDNILDVRRLKDLRYLIHTPIGTTIDVYIVRTKKGEQLLNIHIYMGANDVNRTTGLCGTLNGNKEDEFTLRNGTILSRDKGPDVFASSWKISKSESLLESINHSPEKWSRENTLCLCNSQSETSMCSLTESDLCATSKHRRGQKQTALCHRRVRRSLSSFVLDGRIRQGSAVKEVHSLAKREVFGQTEAMARCQEVLGSSPVRNFTDRLSDDSFETALANCALDLEWTGDTSWVAPHEDDLKHRIENEYERDPDYVAANPVRVQQFGAISCTPSCSDHGVCENGTCRCDSKFYGDTCDIDNTKPVDVDLIEGGDVCDTRQDEGCPTCFVVQTDGLIDGFTCKLTHKQMYGDGSVSKIRSEITNGSRISLFHGECCQSQTDTGSERRRREATIESTVVITNFTSVAVSNDGVHFGEEMHVYTIDSTCQTYSYDVSGNFNVDVKVGMCFINGHCLNDGESSTDNHCMQCVSTMNVYSWTDTCETSSGRDTFTEAELFVVLASVGSGILVVVIVIVTVLAVIYCRKDVRHSSKEDSYLGGSTSKNEQPSIYRQKTQTSSCSDSLTSLDNVHLQGEPPVDYMEGDIYDRRQFSGLPVVMAPRRYTNDTHSSFSYNK